MGGNAPIYYANTLLKFVSTEKYNLADNGFDGFKLRVEFIKSRTNRAGQSTTLIFDQDNGFDPIRTIYDLVDTAGLIEGRNPYRYISGHPELKFDSRNLTELKDNVEFIRLLYSAAHPILKTYLSSGPAPETNFKNEAEAEAYCKSELLPALFDEEE